MLHILKPAPGSRKKARRAGRGSSAGRGMTAGRGMKGQKSRSGKSGGSRRAFEGGQTSLLMRQPKLGGFNNPNRVAYEVVNLSDLEKTIAAGTVDIDTLKKANLVRTGKQVKLLARGEVKKKFDVTVHAASKAAIAAIEKAGGKVTMLK